MSEVMLKNVRISYPSLFSESVFDGKKGKFEATFILDKVEHKDLIAKLEDMQKAMAKDNNLKVRSDRWLLKDGDLKAEDKPELAGKVYLKAGNKLRPLVVDRKGSPVTEADGIIYAGCRVNAIISLWHYNNSFGKGIGGNLKGVQFYGDDDAFGGASVAKADQFDVYEDEF